MSIFNALSPADTDSVKGGAAAIRGLNSTLNTLTSQIFADDLTFLAGWVTNALLSGDPDDGNDAVRAVGSDNIKLASIILTKLPDGVFTADDAGRAKFATGFVSSGLLDPAIVLPDGSVKPATIADNAVVTVGIASLAVTIPKVGPGVAKIAAGLFAGSNTLAATVNTLAFAPDVLVITGGAGLNRVGLAFKSEASGGTGPIHSLWDNGNVSAPFTTAIVWLTNGFTVTPANNTFNDGGVNHGYLALAI